MLPRILNWIIQKLGLKTLIKISLLMLAVGSVAYGLAEVIKGLESGLLFRLVFLAIVLSWLLARMEMRGWLAGIMVFFIGIIVLLILVGQLWRPLVALLRATENLIWLSLQQNPEIPIDPTYYSFAFREVYEGIVVMLNSLGEWRISILEGLPVYDEVATSIVWGWVMWCTASWGGWLFRNHNKALLSILPSGILLSVTSSYSWAGTSPLIALLFFSLLMMALTNYENNEEKWRLARMDFPEDLSKEFALVSVVVIVGLVTAATVLPIFSIKNIVEFTQTFTKPQIEEAKPVIQSFGLRQGAIPREDIGKALRGGLPRSHLMGSGPELEERIVMTVAITGGVPREREQYLTLPLYWRSLTYDEYFGFGWRSSDIILRSYEAGEQVLSTDSPFHRVIQQDYRMAKGETNFLYAAGEILSSDSNFKIAYRPTIRYTEVLNAHGDFFGASIDKSAYRVQSLIPIVNEENLRSAQGDYPEWVLERYLGLVDSIPARVFRLAEELTRNDETNYDKARTLEQYLRGFEYTLDVEFPPLRQDMVDYFLFDLQKGYCDYYATTMVIMARSLGIPSRIAIGYYRGVYDDINRRYIVTEADAHSWVEIYFPGIGWVPFEPTAGREEIGRLVEDIETPDEVIDLQPLQRVVPLFSGIHWDWMTIVLFVIGGGILIVFGLRIVDDLLIQRLTPTKTIQTLYQRLYRWGRYLGVPAHRGVTPSEFSQTLELRIDKLGKNTRFDFYCSIAIDEIKQITNSYIQMLYSSRTPSIRDRQQVIFLWRQLRRRLWFARIRQFIYRDKEGQRNPNTYGVKS